jgi:(4S)-4-hydroxy-5-phosphonooxypentane-2,3-dione isomerase
MYILIVNIHVKPEFVEDFIAATKENARNSVQEAGVARFDFFQQAEDPNRFTLVEVYREQAGHAQHRETAHYQTWRDTVTEMMAEPRTATWFNNVFPDDSGW